MEPTPKVPSGGESRSIPQSPLMTEEAYKENVGILKRLGWRGLRSVAVVIFGLTAFSYARRYRKEQLKKPQRSGDGGSVDEATQRYLSEMTSQGWDVEGHEESLRKEQLQKTRGK